MAIQALLLTALFAIAADSARAQGTPPPRTWTTCAACHAPGAGAVAPSLLGVVGRQAGTVPGFNYSKAMKAAGFKWDEATLTAFLRDPQAAVPGNRMPAAGVSDPAELAQLVHFLHTLR